MFKNEKTAPSTSEKKLYVFSDIEGSFPQGLKDKIEEIIEKNKENKENKEKNENMIAFTGDLIDRGPDSIENLLYMITAKYTIKYPNIETIDVDNQYQTISYFIKDGIKVEYSRQEYLRDLLYLVKNKNRSEIESLILHDITGNDDYERQDIESVLYRRDGIDKSYKERTRVIQEPDDFILICGNRDLNKIRFRKELLFNQTFAKKIIKKKTIPGIPTLKSINDLLDLCTYFTDDDLKGDIFHYNNIDIMHDLCAGKNKDTLDIWEKIYIDKKYSNGISRIRNIYENTMGAGKQIELFIKKYDTTNKLKNVNQKYLFVTLLNVIMSYSPLEFYMITGFKLDKHRDINDGIIYDYNKSLLAMSNLYYNYLSKCELMRKISYNNKIIILSHSGIPTHEEKNIDNIDNIDKINEEYKKFINNYYNQVELFEEPPIDIIKQEIDKYQEEYIKYLRMSVKCTDANDQYINKHSVVLSDHKLSVNGPRQLVTFEDNLFKKYISESETDTIKPKYIYNIFGHQPCGFSPESAMVKYGDTTVYHIDLDISKAESVDYSNTKSYALLELNLGHNDDAYDYIHLNLNTDIEKIKANEKKKSIKYLGVLKLLDYSFKYHENNNNDVFFYKLPKTNSYYSHNTIQHDNFKIAFDHTVYSGGRKSSNKKSIETSKIIYNGIRKGEYIKIMG